MHNSQITHFGNYLITKVVTYGSLELGTVTLKSRVFYKVDNNNNNNRYYEWQQKITMQI